MIVPGEGGTGDGGGGDGKEDTLLEWFSDNCILLSLLQKDSTPDVSSHCNSGDMFCVLFLLLSFITDSFIDCLFFCRISESLAAAARHTSSEDKQFEYSGKCKILKL